RHEQGDAGAVAATAGCERPPQAAVSRPHPPDGRLPRWLSMPGILSRMKIASWNVNSLHVRMPHLQQWLAAFAPDIVGLQETKLDDERFPDDALAALGYRSVFLG